MKQFSEGQINRQSKSKQNLAFLPHLINILRLFTKTKTKGRKVREKRAEKRIRFQSGNIYLKEKYQMSSKEIQWFSCKQNRPSLKPVVRGLRQD